MHRGVIDIGGKTERKGKGRHKSVLQNYSTLQRPYMNYSHRKIINLTASAFNSWMLLNCSDRGGLSFISLISSDADHLLSSFVPGDSFN